jgi:hypothetical protein
LTPSELSKTNIPNVKNILSTLDSSDKLAGDRPRDTNLNTLENSDKYNQARGKKSLEEMAGKLWSTHIST